MSGWASLEASLASMDAEVQALASRSVRPAVCKPAPMPAACVYSADVPRAGSVFASRSTKDRELIQRVYGMDLFGPIACKSGGVADDMTGLQLRIASRLHSRWASLGQLELEETWRLQREEMVHADRFLSAFDMSERPRIE
mmetsp:Transcript_65905/g.123031  ORF Transcript_65905/g.123031 Transcript_65905/m.123031 type:complete len:141 (-) Transcript_65905:150-572(-)